MTATLHVLPGLDGAIHADTPPVARNVEDTSWNVTLDVSGHVNLIALFQAIADDVHLRDAMRILMHNRTNLDLRLCAVRELLQVNGIRQALTITLGPSQAEDLGTQLGEASTEPERCQALEGDCNNFVTDDKSYDPWSGKHMCQMHLALAAGD